MIASIIVRITINALYTIDSFQEDIQQSLKANTWLYPMTQSISYVGGSMMPIAAVLFQLKIGLRQKKEIS